KCFFAFCSGFSFFFFFFFFFVFMVLFCLFSVCVAYLFFCRLFRLFLFLFLFLRCLCTSRRHSRDSSGCSAHIGIVSCPPGPLPAVDRVAGPPVVPLAS